MEIHHLTGPWGTLRVAALGGCVLSWRPTGHGDVLLPVRDEDLVSGRMWHGGIPVCAPWFGTGRGAFEVPFPHGLVSRVPWRTVSVGTSDDAAAVRLRTCGADVAHLPGAHHYPADLVFDLAVAADRRSLSVALTVESPSMATVLDLALHPYFACDAAGAVVDGLSGVAFRDFADDARAGVDSGPVAVGRHLDRVYSGAPDLRLRDERRTQALSPAGARNTVVWNPGPRSGQVPGEAWRRFACVEYGCVQDDAVQVGAGGSHTVGLTVTV